MSDESTPAAEQPQSDTSEAAEIPADNPPESPVESRAIQAVPKTVIIEATERVPSEPETPAPPPWTLQQFFDGEIDLDVELASRFDNMPVMSTIRTRGLGTRSERGVATLATQDGGAQVIFDADAQSKTVQMSFTYGSMLTLRFKLGDLSDVDRSRWLELMQREQGGLAFLWGPSRWEKDYVICISRKYFTNFYAFSPHNFEAAVRMTPQVLKKLLAWLDGFWKQESDQDDEPPKMLTW
jgi:hypothetical protein